MSISKFSEGPSISGQFTPYSMGIFASPEEYIQLENAIQTKLALYEGESNKLSPDNRARLKRVLQAKASELMQEICLLKSLGCPTSELSQKSSAMLSTLDQIYLNGLERDLIFVSQQGNMRAAIASSLTLPQPPITPLSAYSFSRMERGEEQLPRSVFSSLNERLRKVEETLDLSCNFAKYAAGGAVESASQFLEFAEKIASHPIDTASEMVDAFSKLYELAQNEHWETLGAALSPEIHELVTKWETLPRSEKASLAGFAVGKIGADILIPGATIKAVKRISRAAKNSHTMVTLNNLPEPTRYFKSKEVSSQGHASGFLHVNTLSGKKTLVCTVDLLWNEGNPGMGHLKDFLSFVGREAETNQAQRILIRAKFVTDGEILNGLRLAKVLEKRYGMVKLDSGLTLDVYEMPLQTFLKK